MIKINSQLNADNPCNTSRGAPNGLLEKTGSLCIGKAIPIEASKDETVVDEELSDESSVRHDTRWLKR